MFSSGRGWQSAGWILRSRKFQLLRSRKHFFGFLTLDTLLYRGVARMLEIQDTGHVNNAIVLYQHTTHIQLYGVDQ